MWRRYRVDVLFNVSDTIILFNWNRKNKIYNQTIFRNINFISRNLRQRQHIFAISLNQKIWMFPPLQGVFRSIINSMKQLCKYHKLCECVSKKATSSIKFWKFFKFFFLPTTKHGKIASLNYQKRSLLFTVISINFVKHHITQKECT